MKDRGVFERNLTRLLREAYVQVLPRESFREHLERDFMARAVRLSRDPRLGAGRAPGGERGSGPTGPTESTGSSESGRLLRWRPLVGLAAAAVAALLSIAVWWSLRPAGGELETVLARGELALRETAEGPWRGSRAAAIDYERGFLELVTPDGRGVSVRAGGDRLDLEAASSAVLEGSTALATVAFDRGGLTVAHGGPRGARPLRVTTIEGELLVDSGRAALVYGGAAERGPGQAQLGLRVSVESGRTRIPEAERELAPGDEVLLRAGRIVWSDPMGPVQSATAVEPLPNAGGRVPELAAADGAEEPASTLGDPAGGIPVQVSGRVRRPGASPGGDPEAAEAFHVVFLRQVAIPQVAEPDVFEFTGAGGHFELGGLESGEYTAFVRAPGCGLWRSEELVLSGSEDAPIELEVELEAGRRIEGLVVDDETGLPVSGAVIVSETDAPIQILSLSAEEFQGQPGLLSLALSGPDGGFVLEDLSLGAHVLRASAPGYGATWKGPLGVAESAVPVELSLAKGGGLEGRVSDSSGPLEGALLIISLTDFGAAHPVMTYVEALTDAEGHYTMDDLPEGHWPLLNFGAVLDEASALDPELAFVRIEAGEVLRHDFATSEAGVRLAGVVTHADGSPAVGRAIWLTPIRYAGADMISTNTDAEGRFAFEDLAAEHYGMFTSQGSPPDMTLLGDIDLRAGSDVLDHRVQLAGAGLEGRVLDGAGAGGIEFAVIILLRTDGGDSGLAFAGKTFSDAEGRFAFDFAPAGNYEIQIIPTRSAYGLERADGLVLVEGQRLDAGEFFLYPGGALELVATTPDGSPAAGALVDMLFEDGHEYHLLDNGALDVEGRLRVPALQAGRWELRIGGGRYEAITVDVARSDEPTAVSVQLRAN